MKVVEQSLNDILENLQPIQIEWKDDVARRVIAELESFPKRPLYEVQDIQRLLEQNFNDGLLICRLFLGLSKDQFTSEIKRILGAGGYGIERYRKNKEIYLEALLSLGLLDAMVAETNREPKWNDTLVERLRSGRGRAITGQKRGRAVEDFAESVIKTVFGSQYDCRCLFKGPRDRTAKCDFAIPSKSSPNILVEAKGYGATGSKMSDIIGDIEAIIATKRKDTAFLFFTDGVTWRERASDMRKLVKFQNYGDITRIYTYAMAPQLELDLQRLKLEYGL